MRGGQLTSEVPFSVREGFPFTVAACTLQTMEMPKHDLNNPAMIYQCHFLQGLHWEQEIPDGTKPLELTAGQALGGPGSSSPAGTAAWNSCLFVCLPRGSLMLLATPGLNPGKAYPLGMLRDMVLHKGVRPGHGGLLLEVAKAKQRETGSCPEPGLPSSWAGF